MRLKIALAAAALAVCGASAMGGEDLDIRTLAAKLAAQEAKIAAQDAAMNDLKSKLMQNACEDTVTADNITSLNKNARVTIGGLVTTGVYGGSVRGNRYNGGEYAVTDDDGNQIGAYTRHRYKGTSVEMSDAELYVQIDVNDHFDAFLSLDLHSVGDDAADSFGVAKSYYVRWKNICETGFGLKVGRDAVAFGDDENAMGYLDNWTAGGGDGMDWFAVTDWSPVTPGHNGWKHEGVTQITPYWEGLDGALTMELTLFQNLWNENGDGLISSGVGNAWYWHDNAAGTTRRYRSRNYGIGSGAFRVQYSPIEDLTFTAGVINFRSNRVPNDDGEGLHHDIDEGVDYAKNNTAVNLAFRYTPCFFDRLTVWSQWVHGWNVDHVKDYDSDVINYGASLALTDSLSVFAQGDYLRAKQNEWKATGWAAYTGLVYELPVGAVLEAGWRHERTKAKQDGLTIEKVRANMLYANLGFEF